MPPPPVIVAASAPAPQPPAAATGVSLQTLQAMRAVFASIALVLSIRLLLLLALGGAFVLAWQALAKDTWLALAIVIAYAALTVIPLVVLAWPAKPKGGQV